MATQFFVRVYTEHNLLEAESQRRGKPPHGNVPFRSYQAAKDFQIHIEHQAGPEFPWKAEIWATIYHYGGTVAVPVEGLLDLIEHLEIDDIPKRFKPKAPKAV